jgi:predicted membrane channel-forming protein YqfA (hemolysin III family)
MTQLVKIVLHLIGVVLSIGGAIMLLFGLAELVAGLAWSNGRLGDMLLLTLFMLYAVPAGAAMLFGGTWAVSSANSQAYVVPTIQSQRVVGIILVLPAAATSFLLMLGFPHYHFWAHSTMLAVLLVLLALALGGLGVFLLRRPRMRNMNNVTIHPG